MKLYEKLFTHVFTKRPKQQQAANGENHSFREENVSTALDASGIGLWCLDVDNNEMTMNKAMFNLLGIHPRKDPVPMQLDLLNIHVDDIQAFQQSLANVIKSYHVTWNHDFRVVHKENKQIVHIRLSAEVRRSDSGACTMTGGAMDITQLIDAMEGARELQRLEIRHQEDITHQNDMNSMIRLICHELRNPLQGIISNAEIIQQREKEGSDPDTKVLEGVQDILTCALYQSETLDDLIDFETMNLKTYNLNETLVDGASVDDLIGTVVSMFKEACNKKGVSLIIEQTINIRGTFHVKNIQTILINMISNAVKYTHRGTIRVTCAYGTELQEVSAMIKICVHDEGTGVDAKIKDKLFTAYGIKSDNMQTRGSGIGLRTCALIAEAIGGTIGFNGKEKGTTFYFTFPVRNITFHRASISPTPKSLKRTFSSRPTEPKKKILVADDNQIIRRVYVAMLQNDFECHIACNGQDALLTYETALKSSVPFDLIVLDFNMPVKSGIETALTIRKNAPLPLVPIVFSTGDIDSELRNKAKSVSHSHILLKPARKNVMLQLFQALLYPDTD